MNDIQKVLLGAVLSIMGGFLAQLYSEYRKVCSADHDLLVKLHDVLQKLYAIYTGNIRGGTVGQVVASGLPMDLIQEMQTLAFQLRTRGNRSLGVSLVQLAMNPQLIDRGTIGTMLNVTQNRMNPKLKDAYQNDNVTKEIEDMRSRRG